MRKRHTTTEVNRNRLNLIHLKHALDAHIKVPRQMSGRPPRLPRTLDSATSIKERALLRQAILDHLERCRGENRPLYWVTICHPAWTCERGQLDAPLIKEVRNWISRRARQLKHRGFRQLLIGAVDIAWNKRKAVGGSDFWCVHAHFLISVRGAAHAQELKDALAWAFNCPSAPSDQIANPFHARRVVDPDDVERLAGYLSAALALHDDLGKRRHRRSRVSLPNQYKPSDENLKAGRQREITRLFHKLGPGGFWLLSGFRRRGDKVVLEP